VFSFKALTNFKEIIVATTLLLVTQATLILKFEQRKSHAVKGFEEFYY